MKTSNSFTLHRLTYIIILCGLQAVLAEEEESPIPANWTGNATHGPKGHRLKVKGQMVNGKWMLDAVATKGQGVSKGGIANDINNLSYEDEVEDVVYPQPDRIPPPSQPSTYSAARPAQNYGGGYNTGGYQNTGSGYPTPTNTVGYQNPGSGYPKNTGGGYPQNTGSGYPQNNRAPVPPPYTPINRNPPSQYTPSIQNQYNQNRIVPTQNYNTNTANINTKTNYNNYKAPSYNNNQNTYKPPSTFG